MKTCTVCAAPLTGRQVRYCTPLCASRGFNAARKVDGRYAAMVTGCAGKRAEYNKTYRRLLHCKVCGADVWKRGNKSPDNIVCSEYCRYLARWGIGIACEVPALHPSRSTTVPPDHPSRRAVCARCSGPFVNYYIGQKYCTRVCAARAHSSRRDARERGAFVEDVSPEYIYERDRWRCHLCTKRIRHDVEVPHPLAPTLDHLIPLAEGGTHEAANIRAAHFLCNATKSHRGGGEQLLLIG